MIGKEQAGISRDVADRPLRPLMSHVREPMRARTIVIRQGSGWQSLAFLCLCLILLGVVLLGHEVLRGIDRQNQQASLTMASVEHRMQQLESGIAYDSSRRRLLLAMRDHILRVNPRVSLTDAYRYADLALAASEKYPSVDPLLLLAIGSVESRYDPQARSGADARGLYQIWPSTGRLLLRSLGWEYDEAALYLDILFSTYSDPQLVLAEYNGGPLNAGYFRAGVGALAAETRTYVPRVLELYARLKEQFDAAGERAVDLSQRDAHREGKTLMGGAR